MDMMSQVVRIVLFVLVTGCFGAACVWLTLWMGHQMQAGGQDAARAAAENLGLKPKPKPSGTEEVETGIYEGTVDGILITVTAASRTMMVGSPRVYPLPIGQVTVTAFLSAPLPYSLHIGRVANPPGPVIRTGDKLFDRHARVSTGDEQAARSLLASPALRRMIQEFLLGTQAGQAIVTETAVQKNVFDAHLKGEVSILQAVRDVVAIAKAIIQADGKEAPSSPDQREDPSRPPTEVQKQPSVEDWRDDLSKRLTEKLAEFKKLRIVAVVPVAPGTPLKDAHHFFPRGKDISEYDTPRGFPRRFTDEKTPDGLTRVEVECDAGIFCDPRKDEYYNYAGRFLCLLVFAATGEIWDARWEHAP